MLAVSSSHQGAGQAPNLRPEDPDWYLIGRGQPIALLLQTEYEIGLDNDHVIRSPDRESRGSAVACPCPQIPCESDECSNVVGAKELYQVILMQAQMLGLV